MNMQQILSKFLLAVFCLALASTSFAIDPNPKAMSIFKKALAENQAGNYGAALKLYFDAHKEDPEILALDDQGLITEATNWLSDQLDADESDVHANFQMAELKMLQGMENMALGHYEKVVTTAPNSPLAKLAAPLIADIKAHMSANPAPTVLIATGGSGGSAGVSDRERELEAQVSQMRQDLANAKNEISQLKEKLNKPQDGGARGQLDKLRAQFDAYKKEAEQWKLYKNLYFANPQNVRDLRRLSGQ